MRTSENLSVSLPRRTVQAIRRYARTHGSTVSATVKDSVESFLRVYEDAELDRMFAEYYASPGVRREEAELAEEMFKASAWWEEVHGTRGAPQGGRIRHRLRSRRRGNP